MNTSRMEVLLLDGNYFEYTTMYGDTFDILALDVYNNEFKSKYIIEANPQHASTIIFDAGVKLIIPVMDDPAQSTLPPWKR